MSLKCNKYFTYLWSIFMVDKVVWSDEYLLGVNEIDSQHKKLVEYANDLYDVASVGGQEYEKKMQSVLKILQITLCIILVPKKNL